MGLIKKYMNQTRKPNGFLGKMMLKGMNMGHAKLSDFGISTLPNREFFNIAELGCGGGRNIDALLNKYSKARIVGVDYSPLSVEKAKEFNKKNMSRCEIKQGDVSKLDLPKNKFDLVTAFETIYFWPNIDKCFKNIFEILNDNGYFLIVNELEGEDKSSLKYEEMIEGLKVYKIVELECILKDAGFSEVVVNKAQGKAWFSIVAKK
ncbi:MAG: class I SAM-dependent methyltransferase [Clostridiales bacterium]|nr:class I SAM-dependent methyltransferase [Clostridiales bacterium]